MGLALIIHRRRWPTLPHETLRILELPPTLRGLRGQMSMEQDHYLVAPLGEYWAVKLNDKVLGTFAERSDAIRAAITVADSAGQHGIASEVLSQAASGETHPIWVYGRDTLSRE